MKKRWIVLLQIIFFTILFGTEEEVKVRGRVLVPLKLEKIDDMKFGDIVKGNKNVKNKEDGKIKITGEGKTLLTWRDNENLEFRELQNDLKINLKSINGNEKIIANISALNIEKSMVELERNKEKIVVFKGIIPEVPKDIAVGEYKGTVVVRVEYIDVD